MMPAPQDPRDQGPVQDFTSDDERIARVAQTRPYNDGKTSLETAFQDCVNGISLPPSKRYTQGQSFARGGIQLLHRKFPKDNELAKDLQEMRDELNAIPPPHSTYSVGISQGMRVLEVKNPRPDASVEAPPTDLAPGLVGRIEERDYAEALVRVLDIVWEVFHLLTERGLLQFETEEAPIEEDFEDDEEGVEGDEELEDSHGHAR